MKDEDILKIAMQCDPEFTRRTYYLDLLNFGAAIAAAEREACAEIAEAMTAEQRAKIAHLCDDGAPCAIAARIRARSNS